MPLALYEEAILEVLLTRRPSGPPIRSEEDISRISMNNLDFLDEEIKSRGTTIVESVDKHPLDWGRLRDANDSYSSILFDPNREITIID